MSTGSMIQKSNVIWFLQKDAGMWLLFLVKMAGLIISCTILVIYHSSTSKEFVTLSLSICLPSLCWAVLCWDLDKFGRPHNLGHSISHTINQSSGVGICCSRSIVPSDYYWTSSSITLSLALDKSISSESCSFLIFSINCITSYFTSSDLLETALMPLPSSGSGASTSCTSSVCADKPDGLEILHLVQPFEGFWQVIQWVWIPQYQTMHNAMDIVPTFCPFALWSRWHFQCRGFSLFLRPKGLAVVAK